jgi:hypothetical protein
MEAPPESEVGTINPMLFCLRWNAYDRPSGGFACMGDAESVPSLCQVEIRVADTEKGPVVLEDHSDAKCLHGLVSLVAQIEERQQDTRSNEELAA